MAFAKKKAQEAGESLIRGEIAPYPYRKENNIEKIEIPSVIVQKQINSEKAGVAFGANPINSNIKEILMMQV